VKIFPMTEIEERGINAVLDDAVRIASTGTAGYGISIDLDALEPSDAPGVGTPVAGASPLRASSRRCAIFPPTTLCSGSKSSNTIRISIAGARPQ